MILLKTHDEIDQFDAEFAIYVTDSKRLIADTTQTTSQDINGEAKEGNKNNA